MLRLFRAGRTKPGDISKALSLDKEEVQRTIVTLKNNGYVTKGDKLTTKALDVLGN